jgi:DNA invertase Pin-like site-specific DNA recombinase
MPELDKPKRAALYVRVSTLDQNENSQRDDLTRYAERIGWATELYVDHGYSGRKDSRPALNRLMTDVRAGKLDVVCVRSLDRWARSIRHIVLTMEEVAERRVSCVSLRVQSSRLPGVAVGHGESPDVGSRFGANDIAPRSSRSWRRT